MIWSQMVLGDSEKPLQIGRNFKRKTIKSKLTLQEKQNHYNVKFLKGYCSINIKDSKTILKNGQNYITRKLEKEEFEDMKKLE